MLTITVLWNSYLVDRDLDLFDDSKLGGRAHFTANLPVLVPVAQTLGSSK